MKIAKEICIIFGITLVGELLYDVLPLPVPAGVYGLFLLLFCLCSKIITLDQVEHTGNFLLDTMPMMFIPVSVGLIEVGGQIQGVLFPLIFITILSTLIVMVVTGKAAEFMIHRRRRKEK